jgi:beta-glucanase (GH16 family)
MLSYGKFSYEYGYMEVRAQLPAGTGPWPGIWMLGNDFFSTGWPACGEIDVMEATATNPNTIFGTLHYVGNNPGSTLTVQNTSTAYHLYGLEWSPTEIQILVDNVVYFTYSNSNTLPYNQNFFIILNVAMGGTFGGAVDPNFTSGTMKIDYVRVYH